LDIVRAPEFGYDLRMNPIALFFLALALADTPPHSEGFGVGPEEGHDEITAEQRAAIWRDIDANRKRLLLPKAGERPSFIWPLRPARGFAEPAADRIVNYVDHDPAPSSLRDYNCGARTYDLASGYNHKGVDISFWPDSWNMMATRQLDIVAAAAGTIVLKSDGNQDLNCVFNSNNWNAVYVQHDDGSIAWYGHMKSGSLTPKAVGARVLAGEFLGSVGSSGSSSGPHLHFEVYDSSQQLIDPYAGSCNPRNAESWWAQQPPYVVTRINRAITASAPPVFATCGANGQMATPGTINAKTDFAHGETAYFVAFVRDAQPGTSTQFTIRRPDGSVFATNTTPPATSFSSAAYWFVSHVLPATEPGGTWMLEVTLGSSTVATPFTLTSSGGGVANYSDLWWNPAEPGWGVNVNHQGDTFFATWFTYDADGAPLWMVMPEATGTATRKIGDLYRATGTPLNLINGAPAANFPLERVGTGTFEVIQAGNLQFTYTVNGVSQVKTLQRQAFSTKTKCVETRATRVHATNYQDLWWNAAEPGWGINLTHQGETIFATWFTYGAGGRGQWLVASDAQRQPTGEFKGRLYRTAGRSFDQIAGSGALLGAPVDVGEVTLSFTDGEHGRLDYVVDGVAQSKAITRQTFGATAPLCR